MDALVKALMGAGVRWVITILAAKGLIVSDEQYGQLVDAAVLVAMLVWSGWQKHQADKQLEQAKRGLL